jgi:hypothetical protein
MITALYKVREARCSGTAHSSRLNSVTESERTHFEFTQVMEASETSYLVGTPDY